ncbi:MAG: PAS domain S-box protein [Microcoleaceae cyanobacterium]|jgi:PAS domain S-box-containing protein
MFMPETDRQFNIANNTVRELKPAITEDIRQLLARIQPDNYPPVLDLAHQRELHQMQKTIEELKRELQSSEARFRNAIEKNADGIIIVNKKGQVVFVNPSAEYLFNCQGQDLLEQDFFGDLVVESSAKNINIDTEIIPHFREVDTGGVRVAQTEVQLKRTDEETVIVSMRLVETEWEGEMAYLATLRDITRRKRTEEMLWLYNRAMAATSSGIVIADASQPDNPIIYCNPAFEKLTGYSQEEILGHNCRFLQGDDTDNDAIDVIRNALKNHRECRVVLKNYRKDKSYFWNELSISPVCDRAGNLTHFIGVQLDVTERKHSEEELRRSEIQLREQSQQLEAAFTQLKQTHSQLLQSEKMSSLGLLVAGVAHEINNPVSFINGNISYLKEYAEKLLDLIKLYQQHYPNPVKEIQAEIDAIELDFLIEDLPKILSSMNVGIDRICQIVKSLRNFSRMDEAELKSVNIHEGLDSTLMILNHRLKAKSDNPGINIIKNYGDLPLIECYPGPMNQVFMNILSNAIDALEDYNKQRSPEEIQQNPNQIKITTSVINNYLMEIVISDNGPGISEEVIQHIFDAFFTTKPVGKGTGMGLSISYQIIVERHGGKLTCLSELGKGTEFIIKIPMCH